MKKFFILSVLVLISSAVYSTGLEVKNFNAADLSVNPDLQEADAKVKNALEAKKYQAALAGMEAAIANPSKYAAGYTPEMILRITERELSGLLAELKDYIMVKQYQVDEEVSPEMKKYSFNQSFLNIRGICSGDKYKTAEKNEAIKTMFLVKILRLSLKNLDVKTFEKAEIRLQDNISDN